MWKIKRESLLVVEELRRHCLIINYFSTIIVVWRNVFSRLATREMGTSDGTLTIEMSSLGTRSIKAILEGKLDEI